MLNWIKVLIAGKELAALDRYRAACHLVSRWNSQLAHSADSADWIKQVGEGERGIDIEQFRERLRLVPREPELVELLRSAHAIALRKGADTAWDRFANSIRQMGIGSITARVYKVLPSDAD